MTVKPHKEYPELVKQLCDRGMVISDPEYAEKNCHKLDIIVCLGFGIFLESQIQITPL